MTPWTIEVDQISKAYEGQTALCSCSMTLTGGGIYCLMAPSGAGKTTLLRLLAGLERPDSGQIRFVGPTGRQAKPGQLPLAFVFQEDRLCQELGAEKNIALVHPTVSGQALQQEILQLLPEEALKKPVREYSGGMRRRVALLRAMLSPGEIILLDEPFTGLDEESRQAAYAYVLKRREGRTLVFTTHHEEEAAGLGAEMCALTHYKRQKEECGYDNRTFEQ